jgi:integrase
VRRRGSSLCLGILASITRVNNVHDRLCEKALADGVALDFVLYDLRHTFATRMAQEGIDLATLAKSSVTTRSESWNVTFIRLTSIGRVLCFGTKRVRWRWPKLDRPI